MSKIGLPKGAWRFDPFARVVRFVADPIKPIAPPRKLQPCGTPAAYARHLRSNEPPCDKCRAANVRYRANRRRIRKAA